MHIENMVSKFTELPDGLRIHYEESGCGEKVLLFVPGWTMTTSVFERQLEFFANSRTFRFITYDPRSHGQSTVTEHGNHYEQHGTDLHNFVHALDLKNVVLCGWSFGTLATLSYVDQYGMDRLSGLIMLDGPPRATGADNKRDWVTYRYDDADGSQEFFTMGKLRNPGSTNIEFAEWMLELKSQQAIDWIVSMTIQTPAGVAALLNATANFLDYRETLQNVSKSLSLWCVVRV